jgi:hypothetical protein
MGLLCWAGLLALRPPPDIIYVHRTSSEALNKQRRPTGRRSQTRRSALMSKAELPRAGPNGEKDPPYLPQTIEYAIREAQAATAAGLCDGATRLVVALPMGRSRKQWYRLSGMESELVREESATLALHFAEMFKGARMRIVLGYDSRPPYSVPWVTQLELLEEASVGLSAAVRASKSGRRRFSILGSIRTEDVDSISDGGGDDDGGCDSDDEPPDVLIIASVVAWQRQQLDLVLAQASPETAIILFNCLLDMPTAPSPFPIEFVPAYICRSANKTAHMLAGFGPQADGWHLFTETAIFEFEWIGSCSEPGWEPTPSNVDKIAAVRGTKRRSINGYFEVVCRGCESGFWPFMTICSREVLPMPGSYFDKEMKKKSKKPFPLGFF